MCRPQVVAALVFAIAFNITASLAAEQHQKITKKWNTGDWSISYEGDEFERHYLLSAAVISEEHKSFLFIHCADGQFTLTIAGIPRKAMPYMVIINTGPGKPVMLPIMAGNPGYFTVSAAAAEVQIANSKLIGVRIKYQIGRDIDQHYRFRNLAVGKPQLFNVCPPPR